MTRVPTLPLPTAYPSKDAQTSGHENIHNYEPDFWEYEIYRYLENMGADVLAQRYQTILRNMLRLISRERDIIPIKSFLSSWYWLRKEHQTRLELHIRGLRLPIAPPEYLPDNSRGNAPAWPHHPNSCDVLFRFDSRKYIEPLYREGRVRIRSAEKYKDGAENDARTDDELKKVSILPRQHTKIYTQRGEEIPALSDISRSVSSDKYYVLSSSCGFHPKLFSDFEADCCIVITDPKRFNERLDKFSKSRLPNWYFVALPIEYYDPYEHGLRGLLDPAISKEFAYAYQMEFRYAWIPPLGEEARDDEYVMIGSIEDIAFIYDSPTAKQS
jgi:hypothetical protein